MCRMRLIRAYVKPPRIGGDLLIGWLPVGLWVDRRGARVRSIFWVTRAFRHALSEAA